MHTGDFESHACGPLRDLYYFPDYLTEAEEQKIISALASSKTKWVEVRYPCMHAPRGSYD